jgi:diguanylate cyclase (GGDEF)-like protein
MSLSVFCLTLALSKRCNDLESATRELSLSDELTQLYNRRGFYVLGEQALRLAHRAGEPFSVLFIDVDNLKQINDEFGHETGSDLLVEMALLIRQAFREIDVIGRLGGDEFVVAANLSAANIGIASRRLEQKAAAFNLKSSRRYPLSFSMGWASSDGNKNETLQHLLEQADSTMYEAKRTKKHLSRRSNHLALASAI